MAQTAKLKAAVIQMDAGPDTVANVARAAELVRAAARRRARLIALPEVFHYRGPMPVRAAERIPGPSLRPLMALAREFRAWILAGSIYERLPGERRVANTSVMIGPAGRVAARYRKIHLFDARIGAAALRESRQIRPGRRPVHVAAGGLRVGLSVCYDLRFPELFRTYGRAGCHVVTAPSAFTARTGRPHWEILVRARAIENQAFLLAPNQIGRDNRNVVTHGHSLIVGPWGDILAEGSAGREEILVGELDTREIEKARRILPGMR